MEAVSELFEICAQLVRDAGCKKVMVCDQEGEVLAHAGEPGMLGDEAGDRVAQLLADALAAAQATPPTAEELQAALPSGLSACATTLGNRAALVVVYDETTTLDRVRVKMRRARERLMKSLPSDDTSQETPPKS